MADTYRSRGRFHDVPSGPRSSYRDTPNRSRRNSPDSPRDSYNHGRHSRHAPGTFRFGQDHGQDSRGDFSFRHGDSYSGRFSPQRSGRGPRSNDNRHRPGGGRRNDRDRGWDRDQRDGRRRRPVLSANDRPLMSTGRESTPERLSGMEDGHVKFRPVDDLSETEPETDGEVEEDEDNEHPESGDEGEDRPRKKAKLETPAEPIAERPKWSNPDPYTILPPEEERGKRKDVLKMIRKAKVQVDKPTDVPANAVTANNDFISFDFGDDFGGDGLEDGEDDDREEGETDDVTSGAGHTLTDREWPDSEGAYVPSSRAGIATGLSHRPLSIAGEMTDQPHSATSTIPPPPSYSPSDEDIPPPPPLSSPRTAAKGTAKPAKKGGLDGSVVEEWVPDPESDSAPWCTIDHAMTADMADWLNMEISDFYEYIKPREYEHDIRAELFKRINASLQRVHADGKTYCFGSYASGMYLPNSDMDLAFVSDQYMRSGIAKFASRPSWMHRLAARLTSDGIASHGSTQVIFHARVPLIKFVDKSSGLKVDISFEQYNGVVAIETFERWKEEYPVLPVLVSTIKQFLLMRGLSEVYLGGIGGFTVTCLVVSLLQHHPGVSSGELDPAQHLGEMLMSFFDLYGNKFDTLRTGIRMNPPGYFSKAGWFPKRKQDPGRLTILDPNNEENDISGGSSKIDVVQEIFSDAYSQLQARLHLLSTMSVKDRRRERSVLSCILGGDYSATNAQRHRLANLPLRGYSGGETRDRGYAGNHGGGGGGNASSSNNNNNHRNSNNKRAHSPEPTSWRSNANRPASIPDRPQLHNGRSSKPETNGRQPGKERWRKTKGKSGY